MAFRNPGRLQVTDWRGLDSFTHDHELAPDQWFDSNNVLVNSRGGSEVLRSPKTFGSALAGSGPIFSMDEYKRVAGHLLFVDRNDKTFSYDSGGTSTQRRSGQAGNPWTSVNVNDRFQRIDGTEFIQYISSLAVYRNGIDAPAAAPVISYLLGTPDTCHIENSVQASYAYKNTTTGHIGPPSPISNVLGASEDNNTLRVPVVASTQPGVDKIVLFITLDGGSIPYLAIDCVTGLVLEFANSTGNIDLALCAYDVDTLTPETIYNTPPPTNATHMFTWKDRIVLLRGRFVQYSGWETAYAGNAYECWPLLNQLGIPNKADVAISGISTQMGALIFGKEDSYIISGYPSDKVSSPNNTLAVTEHCDPLNWKIGIYESGKDTPALTPFGVMWLDQNKKVRLWTMAGFPQEIAVPLREELSAMTGTITARWHQHGKNAGFYVIRNSTKVLMMMAYQTAEGQIKFGYGKSNVATDAIAVVTYSPPGAFFFGTTAQVYKWLDPDLVGSGWAVGTGIFFKVKLGNKGNFSYIHSLSVEGTNVDSSFTLKCNDQVLPLEGDIDTDASLYSVVDQEGRRHTLEFRWNIDDTNYRSIDALQVYAKDKKRVI